MKTITKICQSCKQPYEIAVNSAMRSKRCKSCQEKANNETRRRCKLVSYYRQTRAERYYRGGVASPTGIAIYNPGWGNCEGIR